MRELAIEMYWGIWFQQKEENISFQEGRALATARGQLARIQ